MPDESQNNETQPLHELIDKLERLKLKLDANPVRVTGARLSPRAESPRPESPPRVEPPPDDLPTDPVLPNSEALDIPVKDFFGAVPPSPEPASAVPAILPAMPARPKHRYGLWAIPVGLLVIGALVLPLLPPRSHQQVPVTVQSVLPPQPIPEPPATAPEAAKPEPEPAPAIQSASPAPMGSPEQPPGEKPVEEPGPQAMAPVAPAPPPVPAPTPAQLLIEAGDVLIGRGDFKGARSYFFAAAMKGDPEGALRMAASYDPEFIKRIDTHVKPDAKKAAYWYAWSGIAKPR